MSLAVTVWHFPNTNTKTVSYTYLALIWNILVRNPPGDAMLFLNWEITGPSLPVKERSTHPAFVNYNPPINRPSSRDRCYLTYCWVDAISRRRPSMSTPRSLYCSLADNVATVFHDKSSGEKQNLLTVYDFLKALWL